MPEWRQSSIRIPPEAIAALGSLRRSIGSSRDACVRALLDDHLRAQLQRAPNDRLTHISTVLRFPPRPPGRRSPDGLERLAIRLEPWMSDAAHTTSLRLPGQAASRGHHDYSRRPLTDEILTALAKAHPFTIEGLEQLPAVLSHGAAVGLWRLTVAATLTPAEKLAMWGKDEQAGSGGNQSDALMRLLHQGNYSWHDPKRFQVALHLARKLLSGEAAAANLEMLQARNEQFHRLLDDLETDSFESPESDLLTGAPDPGRSVYGRGGSVVWRARRSLARQSIFEWLAAGAATDRMLMVDPPGWSLRMPEGWYGISTGDGDSPSLRARADIAQGHVAEVHSPDGRAIAWPYLDGCPVPGFDALLQNLPSLRPTEIIELTLAIDERLDRLFLQADTACSLGFISEPERARRIELATMQTERAIRGALDRARSSLDDSEFAELVAVTSDPDMFQHVAHKHGITVLGHRPYWTWHTSSIDVELGTQSPDRLAVLGRTRLAIYQHRLEREMELAARDAFAYGKPPVGPIAFDGKEYGLP